MGRAPCCEKVGLNRGSWTPEEEKRLMAYIYQHGHANWVSLPKQAGLLRCGKSCRLRWINYLRLDIKRGNFTADEEETLIRLHASIANNEIIIVPVVQSSSSPSPSCHHPQVAVIVAAAIDAIVDVAIAIAVVPVA